MRLGFAAWLVALAACGADSAATTGPNIDEPVPASEEPAGDAAVDVDAGADAALEAPGPDVSYASAVAKSVHNAYERAEPLIDQLLYHRVRSIELDIHAGKAGATAPNGEWFVYHDDVPFFRNTSCERLSQCLGQLAAFHRALPRHEVVTLWIDLKDSFSPGHAPADLDALLAKALGRANLFAPGDARARCPSATTVREALTGACAFPVLDELRGKFVVAVTGGGACDAASAVMTYDGAMAFRAPNRSAACTPSQGAADDAFVNLSWDERAQATEARSLGLVTRMYKGGIAGGLDTKEDFEGAIAAGALHAATDKASADADGWSSTHDHRGFPFRCAGCEGHVEPGAVFGVRATSGDLWGAADSGYFALAEPAATPDEWSALVSVPSSHVHEMAKACLVARASESPGAPYAAACRPFDDHPPRMQVRMEEGGPTTSATASPASGLSPEVPAFLRLRIEPNGGKSKVTAESSGDGLLWTTMGTTDLEGTLPVRGVAVSSHDSGPLRALFADVRRNGTPLPFSALTKKKAIGAGATGDAFLGVLP